MAIEDIMNKIVSNKILVITFFVGLTAGWMIARRNAKIVVNGDNNTVYGGYNSNNGHGNGCAN